LPACADGRTSSTDPSAFPSYQRPMTSQGKAEGRNRWEWALCPGCKHPAAYAFEHAIPVVMVHARRARTLSGVRWRGRLWVQCRLRRAPPPLALSCLRRCSYRRQIGLAVLSGPNAHGA
jgi:hypothetical protein